MLEHKPQVLESLRTKLEALVDIILDEAEQNPEFLSKLEVVLCGDSTTDQNRNSKRKRKKINFDAVAYLSNHSIDDLKQYLLEQKEADLPIIAKQEGLKSLSKKLSREETVDKIVEFVSKTLYQGASFLKNSSDLELPSSASSQMTVSQEQFEPIEPTT